MGVCASNEKSGDVRAHERAEKNNSLALDNKMRNSRRKVENVHKLLLLGAGESGKSTLFKQMIMIYGTKEEKNMDEDVRKGYIEFVFNNLTTNAQALALASAEFGPAETPEGQEAVAFCRQFQDDQGLDAPMTDNTARMMRNLWADPGIQKTYEQRSHYQLNDSTAYFFNQLDTLARPDYIPSFEDILRVRIRTTGIVEHNFTIETVKFQMYDVGGQRNERQKWIHCFDNVQAVLYVAAMSEFDQVLYEEQTTNRMTEALTLFAEISSSSYFKSSSVILFLNKMDLFAEKIKTKSITASACPELKQFRGDVRDYKQTSEFVASVFQSKYKNGPGRKQLYSHITCATNQENVKYVFNDVKSIMINNVMLDGGFLDSY